MGSSQSTAELLEIPLHAQSPPVLATSFGSVASEFTSLCVKRESSSRSVLKVVDAATQQHVFDFKFPSLSTRCILQAPDARPLLTVKRKHFSRAFCVYESEEREAVSFEICVGNRHVIHADFHDRLSGRECRLVLDGSASDRVVLFYLEYGYPTLLPKPKRDDIANGHRFQPVGRIRRLDDRAFVEAAPGVDLTLLLHISQVWLAIKEARSDDFTSISMNNTVSTC
jgi:hypothetical protein